MKFLDQVKIYVKAGNGGDGPVTVASLLSHLIGGQETVPRSLCVQSKIELS